MMRTTLILLLLCGFLAAQDVIHLSNGATLEGTIVAEGPETVTVRQGSGTIKLQRSLIAMVARGVIDASKDVERALLTLSRFEDHESWHFLYRRGRRVGYRTVSLTREAMDGIPCYAIEDRLVFLADPGQGPTAELVTREYVDAELRPMAVSCRNSSGSSVWELEGRRDGDHFQLSERAGGWSRKRRALFRRGVVLWRSLLARLSSEVPPDRGYTPFKLFDPRAVALSTVSIERLPDRLPVRGRPTDVIVYRSSRDGRTLETWMDMAGHVVREEIGSPFLVSLIASREEVAAFMDGSGAAETADLGLEFLSQESGLRLLRPDAAWELDVPENGGRRLVSFMRPGLRATVDVFRLQGYSADTTVESLALGLFGRMQAGAEGFKASGPDPVTLGIREALRFEVTSRRRKQEIRTLGTLLKVGDQTFVILCAAPVQEFDRARPAFEEVLESLHIERPLDQIRADPFASDQARSVSRGG